MEFDELHRERDLRPSIRVTLTLGPKYGQYLVSFIS